MSRPLALVLSLLLASTSAGAAPPVWRWEHPALFDGQIRTIHGAAPDVLAAGRHGALFRSRDGGRSWSPIASGTAEDLHGIAGGDPLWIAVGARGTLLRSRDGAVFERRPTGVADALVSVAVAGRLVLAVTEQGAILRSQDGAETFRALPGVSAPATSIAIDPTGVLVGTEEGLWRSTDRGATFARITDEPIHAIRVAPDGTVYALGGGHVMYMDLEHCALCHSAYYEVLALYRSLDGATWRRRAIRGVGPVSNGWWPPRQPRLPAQPPSRSGHNELSGPLRQARPLSPCSLAIGPRGKLFIGNGDDLYTSTDGGETLAERTGRAGVLWAASGTLVAGSQIGRRPLTERLYGIAATPSGRVYAVGEGATIAVRTATGWAKLSAPTWPDQTLQGVYATDQLVVAVGGNGLILHSTDGQTFAHRASDRITGLGLVWGIGDEVFAAGPETLLSSSDRGRSWESVTTPWDEPTALSGTASDLYVLSGGDLYHSADRGRTWTVRASKTKYGAVWASAAELFVVGAKGLLARSRDRGATWTPLASGTALDLAAIWGDGDDLYIAGGVDEPAGSVVMRSRDRGATWHREEVPLPAKVVALSGSARRVWGLSGGAIVRGAR